MKKLSWTLVILAIIFYLGGQRAQAGSIEIANDLNASHSLAKPCDDSLYIFFYAPEGIEIAEARIYYRINLTDWIRDAMSQVNDSLYQYVFAPMEPGTRLDYYLEIEDIEGNIRKDPTEAPFNFYTYFWGELRIIDNHPCSLPQTTALFQNYPNPFNASTTIAFEIAEPGQVTLRIYDLLGREIQTLIDSHYEPGQYAVKYDASQLSSGYYFSRLQTANYDQSKKLLLIK